MLRIFAMIFLLWLPATTFPQAVQFHRLTHNGKVLEYALILPDHFNRTTTYPVLLALPPGDQSKQLVMNGLHLYWEPQAKKRGWVVISPAAPEGMIFYTGAENEIPNLLDEVSKSVKFEGNKAHLAGLSNGGRSAYRVVTEYPELFLSLTVLPGVPPDARAVNALGRIKGIPVAAFVGEQDSEWVRDSRNTKRKLDALGIENTLVVVPGAGHVIALDSAKLFDLLERRRPKNAASTTH
jgi:pimeloyl-ACP methyl ester carboxylesterase